MSTNRIAWLVGVALLAAGCSKSEPAAAPPGGTSTGAKPAAAAAAAAPAASAKADVYVQGILQSLSSGDAAAVWNALPAKYQADVTGLKNEFASKMPADLWNKAFTVVGKAAGVLKDKKEFMLKSAPVAGAGPEGKVKVEQNYDAAVALLATLANSEIKTVDGLKATDPGRFLSSTGSNLLSGGIKIFAAADPMNQTNLDKLRQSKVVLVKEEGDTAVLKMETPGENDKEEKTFKKVDGKWLPEDMVKDWDKQMADAKSELAMMAIPDEQKGPILGILAQVDSTLDKLAAAKDQAAFDAEMQGAMIQLLPVIGMFSGAGGAMSGPGATTGPPPDKLPPGAGLPPGPGGIPAGIPPLPALNAPTNATPGTTPTSPK